MIRASNWHTRKRLACGAIRAIEESLTTIMQTAEGAPRIERLKIL